MSMTDEARASWLTRDAFDRLKSELAGLIENRPVIAAEINARREEGDLRENGGYHSAKEEQGKQEARIRQLTQLLESATVGEAPSDTGVVEPGMVVTIELAGDPMTFLLGSREASVDDDLEVYSATSPLGKAIIGKKAGDTTSYTSPNGKSFDVKVISAKPYAG